MAIGWLVITRELYWHSPLGWVVLVYITDPQTISDFEFATSEKVTSPLVGLSLVSMQDMSFGCQ